MFLWWPQLNKLVFQLKANKKLSFICIPPAPILPPNLLLTTLLLFSYAPTRFHTYPTRARSFCATSLTVVSWQVESTLVPRHPAGGLSPPGLSDPHGPLQQGTCAPHLGADSHRDWKLLVFLKTWAWGSYHVISLAFCELQANPDSAWERMAEAGDRQELWFSGASLEASHRHCPLSPRGILLLRLHLP